MFPLAQLFLLLFLSFLSSLKERVLLSLCSEHCAVTEGELSALIEKSKESVHGGVHWSEPLTADGKGN